MIPLTTSERENTEKLIERVNKYLSFMRYKLADEEKLKRIETLNRYYSKKKEQISEEVLSSTFGVVEHLAGELTIPLKVRGVFLTEGRPRRKHYSKEELEKAASNPVNQRFPLMLDHKDNEAGQVVGIVDKIEYDDSVKGLRWWGHINDERYARNVMDRAIQEVSVTVYADEAYSEEYGVIGRDLTFKELSLVMKGADKGNYIEVDK